MIGIKVYRMLYQKSFLMLTTHIAVNISLIMYKNILDYWLEMLSGELLTHETSMILSRSYLQLKKLVYQ